MSAQHTPGPKPTDAQLVVLKNAAAGRDMGAHLRTRSDYGGFTATLRTLYRREWLDANGITDAGRAAIAKATGSTTLPTRKSL